MLNKLPPSFFFFKKGTTSTKEFQRREIEMKSQHRSHTHKNANNERGRRTHPQAKEEEGECFAEDVNFMPNKVNERATSIYIPLL
jgi:hypothetical protein